MREEVSLLILGGIVLDPRLGVIVDGCVAVRDSRIVWVGGRGEAERRFEAEKVIDAGKGVVLPGLIDLHTHNAQYFLRNWVDDRLLALPPIWLTMLIPFEAGLERRHVKASALLTMLGMIRSGTTCFVEAGGPHPDAIAEAVAESGMRGIVTRSNIDLDPSLPMYLGTEEVVEANRRLFEEWDGRGDGRVRVWFSLRELMLDTLRLVEELRTLAEERGTYLTIHLAEDTVEVNWCLERYGVRPVELLFRRGFLDGRVLASHMIYLSPVEVGMVARSGASVAWCPMVDARLMSLPRIDSMLASGVNVGFGSDGGIWCNLDLFEQARVGRAVVKASSNSLYHDKTQLDSWTCLRMLTENPGKAIHMRVGRLSPGYLADIITLEWSSRCPMLPGDPVESLINHSSGLQVRNVVVNGEVVMEDGVVKTLDEDRVVEEAVDAAEELGEMIGELRSRVKAAAGGATSSSSPSS